MPSPIGRTSSPFQSISILLQRRSSSSPPDGSEQKAQAKLYKSLVQASNKKAVPKLNIRGLPLRNSKVVTLSPTGEIESIDALGSSKTSTLNPHRTPPGFVLGGDIELFGTGLPAKLYKFFGAGKSSGVLELVHLDNDVLLKELLKGLEKHPFGEVKLSGAKFTYRIADEDTKSPAGVYFESTVALDDGPLIHIGNTLDHIFGTQKSTLQLTGYVSKERNWSKALSPRSFTLKAVIRGLRNEKGPLVTFTEVGVELMAERSKSLVRGNGKYKVHVNFFGKLALKVPGNISQLDLGYTLHEDTPGVWTLKVVKEGEEWVDVAGFKGLKLSNLQLVAEFPMGKIIEGFSFKVESTMNFGKGTLVLQGEYNNGQFYVQSEVPHCTLDDIRELYSSMTDRELEPFNHSVDLKNIVLRIDKNGLTFSGEITIDTHRSVKSSIAIKRDGISITGAMLDIKLGEVTIEKVELDIFIGRISKNTTSRESGFSIEGKVAFHNLEIEVALYTLWSENEGVQWTVYGELEGTDMKLNHLAPDVEDTWLDLQLRQVAFIVSNMDSPAGEYNVFDYPIQKGVQFCATIDRVEQLEHVTRKEVTGLVLRAAYSSAQGFSFGIILPTPIGMSLGKHLTSGPVSLTIVASKIPQLMFEAKVNIHPPRQKNPLVFTFGLKASFDNASGFGQMTNYWVNPFGINEKVKIGPDMCIEIEVIYALLAASGAPSSIKLSGGMAIGDTEAQCAIAISENPLEELVKASLSELSATDLVKFASEVCGQELTLPPEDLMAFRDVLIYVSTGVSVGKTYYPAGVSFKGEIELLGKQAAVEATVGATTKISAAFDELTVGPLTIAGYKRGDKPSTVVELGLSKQHIAVDGSVKLLAMDASIHGILDILPKPDAALTMELDFAEALDMSLDARVIGMPDFSNLHQADFRLHALLEQDILDYLITQIKTHFMAILRFLKNGLEAAHEFIDEACDAIEDTVSSAVTALEDAKEQFKQKEDSVFEAITSIKSQFEEGVHTFEEQIGIAKKELDIDLSKAHHELEQSRIQQAVTVTSTVAELRKSQRDVRKKIRGQLKDIRALKEETKSSCGHVDIELQKAQDGVLAAQDTYDQCCKKYVAASQELEDAPFFRKIDVSLKVSRIQALKDDALCDLNAAKAALGACQMLSQQNDYDSRIKSKADKKLELEAARLSEKETFQSIQKDLEARKAAQESLLKFQEQRLQELDDESKSPVLARIKDSERSLEGFRVEKSVILEQKKKEQDELHKSEESRRLQEAKIALRKVAATRPEKVVIRTIIEEVNKAKQEKPDAEEHEKHASFVEKILDDAENALKIELIELDGSAKALIHEGRPLKARVKGIVAGKKFDIVLDYSLGDVAGFVKALWGLLWEGVKNIAEGVEDFFDEDAEAVDKIKEGLGDITEVTKKAKPVIDDVKEVTKVVRVVEKSEQTSAKKSPKLEKAAEKKVDKGELPVAEKKSGQASAKMIPKTIQEEVLNDQVSAPEKKSGPMASLRRKLSKRGRKSISNDVRRSMVDVPAVITDGPPLASDEDKEPKRRSWYAGMNIDAAWKVILAAGGEGGREIM